MLSAKWLPVVLVSVNQEPVSIFQTSPTSCTRNIIRIQPPPPLFEICPMSNHSHCSIPIVWVIENSVIYGGGCQI